MAAEEQRYNGIIPVQVLDSLCSRFILNIPTEESADLIRAFFQIELAHWFYIDFYRVEQPNLPGLGMRDFSKIIFDHCPSLSEHASNVEEIYTSWREYKKNVPTYGAILLDSELQYLLMVQSFLSRTSWGFPKGKVNKDEEPHQCAIREVKEETGFDIGKLLDPENYIEATINEGLSRLYIVPNVPMDTKFKPLTRGEIKDVKWFQINHLPNHKRDQITKVNLGLNPNSFFMVMPFMKCLKKKIAAMKSQKITIKSRDSAFTPTILKNPVRQGTPENAAQKRGSPLQPIQNKENNQPGLETHAIGGQQKSRQQQIFEQGCKEEWDKYFCGIDDARGPAEQAQNVGHNHRKPDGRNRKQHFEGTKLPTEDITADSVPAESNSYRHSGKGIDCNIFFYFELDKQSIMRTFDETLFKK